MLILVSGLPGTGKTTLSQKLAEELDAVHLYTDLIRRKLFKERTYSEEEKEKVYLEFLKQAAENLKNGKIVILDATFYKEELRREAIEIAKKNKIEYYIIECVLGEMVLKDRIDRRVCSLSEADFDVYMKIKKIFEEIKEEHLRVNTNEELKEQVQKILNYILIESLKKKYKLIQTHISWLFLDGENVYKIKKPVNFSFLDFSTLEKRKFYCEEEIRLNKRLAPEMYIDIVPIMSNFEINGKGKIIEYAVKMKELPQENKMDHLLKENKVKKEQIKEIAEIIYDFHSKIKTIEEKKYGSPELLKEQIDDLNGVKDVIEGATGMGEKVDFVLEKCSGFIEKNKKLMKERQRKGRIKDCHGDLHTGNIFILEKEGPIIFDCIEFNKDFRHGDIIGEIAFLAMDLDAQGRGDFSNLFIEEYKKLSGDTEINTLLNLYKCYRANVRVKVAALGYRQSKSEEGKKNMKKYLKLAEKYAKEL